MPNNSTGSQTTSAYDLRQEKLTKLAKQMPEERLTELEAESPALVLEIRLRKLELRNLPLAEMHAELVKLTKP